MTGNNVTEKIQCIETDRSVQQCRTRSDCSDQDLHGLPFYLHLSGALLYFKTKLFQFKQNYSNYLGG